MISQLCVCTSGKSFAACCHRLLSGSMSAKTPLQLMRSRFSAFALGGHGAYLLSTWLSTASEGLSEFELSQASLNWQRLEIIDKSQNGERGSVEFKAYYLDHNSKQQLHHEISEFRRISGRWFYAKGQVPSK